MNRRITTTAERARTRIVARRPVRPHSPTPTPAVLPLAVLAAVWRWAPPTGPGVLGWPAWRGPLNGSRALVARCWPRRWTGRRHPLANLVARMAWTLTGAGIGLAALAAAYTVTLMAAGVWVVAHVVGVVLILAGWSPPPSGRHLETELATIITNSSTMADPAVTPSPTAPTSTVAGDEPWAFNTRTDPWLVVERARVEELRRYNDRLDAEATRPPAPVPTNSAMYRPAGYRPRGWRAVQTLAAVSVVAGLVWFAAAALLGLASTTGIGPQPPTLDQIQSSINQPYRTTTTGPATTGTGS